MMIIYGVPADVVAVGKVKSFHYSCRSAPHHFHYNFDREHQIQMINADCILQTWRKLVGKNWLSATLYLHITAKSVLWKNMTALHLLKLIFIQPFAIYKRSFFCNQKYLAQTLVWNIYLLLLIICFVAILKEFWFKQGKKLVFQFVWCGKGNGHVNTRIFYLLPKRSEIIKRSPYTLSVVLKL